MGLSGVDFYFEDNSKKEYLKCFCWSGYLGNQKFPCNIEILLLLLLIICSFY